MILVTLILIIVITVKHAFKGTFKICLENANVFKINIYFLFRNLFLLNLLLLKSNYFKPVQNSIAMNVVIPLQI